MVEAVRKSNLDERSFKFKNNKGSKYVSQQRIGQKKLLENELILRSKLSLIDKVVTNHIDQNIDFSLGKQVVKVLDVSEFPKKKIPVKRQRNKRSPDAQGPAKEGPYGK